MILGCDCIHPNPSVITSLSVRGHVCSCGPLCVPNGVPSDSQVDMWAPSSVGPGPQSSCSGSQRWTVTLRGSVLCPPLSAWAPKNGWTPCSWQMAELQGVWGGWADICDRRWATCTPGSCSPPLTPALLTPALLHSPWLSSTHLCSPPLSSAHPCSPPLTPAHLHSTPAPLLHMAGN